MAESNELHFIAVTPDADTLAAFDADGDPWRWCEDPPKEGVLVVVFHRDVRMLPGGVSVCLHCGRRDDDEEVKS